MADRTKTIARLVTYLWFFTTAFSVVAVVVRYVRIGEVSWPLVAAAAFTLIMGITAVRRSRSGA